MFEDRRKAMVVSLIIAVLILLVLILALLFWPKSTVKPNPSEEGQNINRQGQQVQTNLPESSPQRIKEESSYPLGLKQLAMSFAERYGSYSSDLRFKNLDDLMPFVSVNMAQKIKSAKTVSPVVSSSTGGEIFQGFTTKALGFELKSLQSDAATVVVSTQRLTYLGPGKDANISYKKIELKFIKSGSEWKVDDAIWQ